METLAKDGSHLGLEQGIARFHHAVQSGEQFKTYELFLQFAT